MAIHVNIGEAKTQLSKLIAAALRGEEVVVDKDGKPQVRLEPVAEPSAAERERLSAKRRSALGMWKKEFEGFSTDLPPSMTDGEIEERYQRKFGPAA
jgi:antitoxin (DNA-binding transcriptional repressor) of toxin-antitoxin stability system